MDDTQAPVAEKFPAPLLPEESGEQARSRPRQLFALASAGGRGLKPGRSVPMMCC